VHDPTLHNLNFTSGRAVGQGGLRAGAESCKKLDSHRRFAMSETFQDAPEQNASDDSAPGADHAAEDPAAGLKLPKVDFSTFLLSLASSALMHLGEVPNPETGKNDPDLHLAKHTIDIVCMLQDKIKNGLSDEEERLLEGILYELRMKYVIKAK